MRRVQAPMPSAGVPSQLGGYRIIGHLGRKAAPNLLVATVLDAGRPDKLYVLRILPGEDFDNVEAVATLVKQARTMTLLHHPNIVQTYEVVVDEAVTFMVREYLDGQSLESILAVHEQPGARGLDLGMRLRLVCDVLDGLHYAHELRDGTGRALNVVHGDATPHNIFVTYEGHAKLLDVGFTEAVTMSSPTRVETVKGKVAYLAPEQVGNSEGTRASDIFQIGLLLWEGAVGHRAWQDMDDYEILLRLNSKYGTLFVPPAGADSDLVTICQRATALSPEERYPTARHFKNDVAAFMARRGIAVKVDAIGRYVTDRFALQRRELRQTIQARLKSDDLDELGPLVSSDTVVEAATVVEPGRVVQAAAPADSGSFDARDTVVEAGTLAQAAAPADSGGFEARDTVVEPGTVAQAAAPADSGAFDAGDTVIDPSTVVEPGTASESGAAGRAGTTVDSGPASDFSASVVFHEPMYKPMRPSGPTAPTSPPPPGPAPAEVSGAVDPQPAAPSGVQEDKTAAPPEKARRPRWVSTVITVAAGLLGVVLAYVLASGPPGKEPSKPATPSPPPSATVSAPSVVPPTGPRAETVPASVGHEPKKAAEPAAVVPAAEPSVEPAAFVPAAEPAAVVPAAEPSAEPTTVVPADEPSSRKAPALRPKPSGTSSKVAAAKRRVRSTKAAASRRGKRARGAAAKHQKPKRWP